MSTDLSSLSALELANSHELAMRVRRKIPKLMMFDDEREKATSIIRAHEQEWDRRTGEKADVS